MNIEQAKHSDGWLMLKTTPAEALNFVYTFKAGDYEISKSRQKRSNRANKYAWLLINKIASRVRVSPESVYRDAITNISGAHQYITVRKNAADDFIKHFIGNHVGRRAEVFDEVGDAVELLLTYGSSDFDRRQMSELIDVITQDCKSLEIETEDEGYVRSLLESIPY